MNNPQYLPNKIFYARLKKRTLTSLAIILITSLVTTGYLLTVHNILLACVVVTACIILVAVNLGCSHWNLIRKLRKMGLTDGEIEKYKAGELALPADKQE